SNSTEWYRRNTSSFPTVCSGRRGIWHNTSTQASTTFAPSSPSRQHGRQRRSPRPSARSRDEDQPLPFAKPMKRAASNVNPRFFETPSEMRTWLQQHHATAVELLVGYHKRHVVA